MLISLTGTGGVGKSTLAKVLAEKIEFDYREVPTRKVSKEVRGSTKEGQDAVYEYYQEFFSSLTEDTVSTRCNIDVMGYSKAYGVWEDDYIDELVKKYKESSVFPDYIFYIPIEFALKADGDRETFADKRVEVDEAILDILTRNNIPFHTVKGTVEERMQQIIDIIS